MTSPLFSDIKTPLKKSTLTFFIWQLYIILSPFYIFESPLPQPADYLIVLLILLSPEIFISHLIRPGFPRHFFVFLVYTILVNCIWTTIYSTPLFLLSSLFYAFNLIIVIFIATHFNNSRFLRSTFIAILLALGLQVMLSFIYPNERLRSSLFFNNPNQLGYWALITYAIIYIQSQLLNIKHYVRITFLISCSYLVALSVSRAAILSMILLVLLEIPKHLKRYIIFIIIFSLSIFAIFSLYKINVFDLNLAVKVATRIFSEIDYSLAERGYDRILNNPVHLLFGAGEALPSRFDSVWSGEIHSTLGTALFAYGIFGFILVFRSFLICLNGTKMFSFLVVPVFVYSLTHMGMRFSHFWILLAFIYYGNILQTSGNTIRHRKEFNQKFTNIIV